MALYNKNHYFTDILKITVKERIILLFQNEMFSTEKAKYSKSTY